MPGGGFTPRRNLSNGAAACFTRRNGQVPVLETMPQADSRAQNRRVCRHYHALVLAVSASLKIHPPNTPELVANATHATEPASAPETVNQPLKESLPALKMKPQVHREEKNAALQPETQSESTTGRETAPVAAALPPLATAAAAAPAAPPPLPRAAPPTLQPSPLLDGVASNVASAQTGIAGTITDAAGAAIPGAVVKVRAIAGTSDRNLTSDRTGQFNVAGLEPGRYELQVSSPGFKQMTEQVDIQPNQVARADSTLSVGSVLESVTVTAETAQVQLESKSRSAVQPSQAKLPVQARSAMVAAVPSGIAVKPSPVQLLPNKLPAVTTVVKGKLMLATDSAGTLFLSQNAGKKWKAVKPVWHGKVVSLVALATDPAFQLTTDAGTIWLSRDGSHWYATPAQK